MNNKLLSVLVVLVVFVLAFGQMKVVKLKTGQTIEGEVTPTKDKTGYQIKTKLGAVVVIPADQVESIEDLVRPEDEFDKRLGRIDPKSPEARYILAEWALKNGLLTRSRGQLLEALKLKADYIEAVLLLRQVEARIRAATTTTKPARPGGPGWTPGTEAPGGPTLRSEWLLTNDDIQNIRLEELRATDRVSIRFRNDLLDRFIAMMEGRKEFKQAGYAGRFRALSDVGKAVYILDNIGREQTDIKDDIIVRTDPSFMVKFRSAVFPTVGRYCAAPHCHGGSKPLGGLKLFGVRVRSANVDYTNFLILDTYTKHGWRMVNRNDADLSLLLQFGLPAEQAEKRHPKADRKGKAIRVNPMFTSRKSPLYKRMLQWIESLKGPLHPDYRLKWRPPLGMKLNLTGRPELPSSPEEPQPEDQETDEPEP